LESNTGSNNTAVGTRALQDNITGSGNTAIGTDADVSSGALANATAIGYRAFVGASNSLVLGSINGVNNATSSTNIGIGTTTPGDRLDVNGAVLLEQITAPGTTTDRLYNVGGTLTWNGTAITGSSGWGLTGNSIAATDFIGSTNNQPLVFKQNNEKAGLVDLQANGNTFFGFRAGNVNASTWNTAVGSQAFRLNTSGLANSAFGERSLELNTTGSYNVALGNGALLENSTGGENVAVGHAAMQFNKAGTGAIAVGRFAMQYANDQVGGFTNTNVAVGYSALRGSATSSANTGLDDPS
jgi:hypothetical protein